MRMLLAALTLSLLFPLTAWSLDNEPFTLERFEALQAEGSVVLIDVHAKWCPTCARQQKILTAYQEAKPDADLHILVVDFDADKKWVTHFRAPRQSTLLIYRNNEQLWFSVAETNQDKVFAALDEALVN